MARAGAYPRRELVHNNALVRATALRVPDANALLAAMGGLTEHDARFCAAMLAERVKGTENFVLPYVFA